MGFTTIATRGRVRLLGACAVAALVVAGPSRAAEPPLPPEYQQLIKPADALFYEIETVSDDECLTESEFDRFYARAESLAEAMATAGQLPDAHAHFSGWNVSMQSYNQTEGSAPDQWTPYGQMGDAMDDIWQLLDDLDECPPPGGYLHLFSGLSDRANVILANPGKYQIPGPKGIALVEAVRPYYRWDGFYVGAQVVGQTSSVNTIEYLHLTSFESNFINNTNGSPGGGVNLGYNWRPFQHGVVGVQVQLNGMHDSEMQFFSGGESIGSSIDFTGSLFLNGGYLVTPRLQVYGQIGATFADQDLHIKFSGPTTDVTKLTPGITAGFGVEYMLPRHSLPSFGGAQSSLFLSYDHTWYASESLDAPAASPSFDYKFERKSDMFALGIRLHY